MKTLIIAIFAVFSSGCALTPKESRSEIMTGVVAIVRSYREAIPLGTKQPEPNYFLIDLEIVAPEELRGAVIEARSQTPLKETASLRKTGASLSLDIENLRQNRGFSSAGDGHPWQVVYFINISNIKKITTAAEPALIITDNSGLRR